MSATSCQALSPSMDGLCSGKIGDFALQKSLRGAGFGLPNPATLYIAIKHRYSSIMSCKPYLAFRADPKALSAFRKLVPEDVKELTYARFCFSLGVVVLEHLAERGLTGEVQDVSALVVGLQEGWTSLALKLQQLAHQARREPAAVRRRRRP